MEEVTFNKSCSYLDGINFMNMQTILCNRIPEIDTDIYASFMDFNADRIDTIEDAPEIFQFFITDATSDDVKFMTEHFDSYYFAFSNLLDCYILCVTHYGTSWDYVSVGTDLDIK